MRKYDVIAWPLKCLEQIGGSEAVVDALLELIEGMDVDYERDPDKKVQTLLQLEERPDARILDAVKRFLDDVNEPARFHAACTLLSQEKAGTASGKDVQMALLEQLVREESGRVKACILDGFHERSWTVPEDQLEAVRANLPTGYLVDRQRKIKRK